MARKKKSTGGKKKGKGKKGKPTMGSKRMIAMQPNLMKRPKKKPKSEKNR